MVPRHMFTGDRIEYEIEYDDGISGEGYGDVYR